MYTTYEQALKQQEITEEICVYPSRQCLFSPNGIKFLDSMGGGGQKPSHQELLKDASNFYDCFGSVHHFFRPYAHTTLECKVRILPFGYCYSNEEIVWTKSKKSLISHTSLRTHPLAPASALDSRLGRIVKAIKNAKKRLAFLLASFFNCRKELASIALLYRDVSCNYGHFIKETIAGYHQLKLANIEPDFYILPCNTTFQKQMYALLGIPEEKIIPTNPRKLIHAKELIIPTLIADYEIIEYRKHLHYRSFILPPFIYTMYDPIISRLLTSAPKPQDQLPKKIFLARPQTSNRNIQNHTEVEKVFKDFGYTIITPDTMSLSEQMRLFASVDAIASMHGAGLDNTIFAKEGTKVFEIFPKYYHDGAEQIIALARQCKYDYIVGETSDLSPHPQQENVYINPNKLAQALTKHLNPQRAR